MSQFYSTFMLNINNGNPEVAVTLEHRSLHCHCQFAVNQILDEEFLHDLMKQSTFLCSSYRLSTSIRVGHSYVFLCQFLFTCYVTLSCRKLFTNQNDRCSDIRSRRPTIQKNWYIMFKPLQIAFLISSCKSKTGLPPILPNDNVIF